MRPLLKLPHNQDRTITRGDTWYGVGFKIIKDGFDVDLTGATVKITFRHPAHNWTIETGNGITLTDPVAGEMAIDKIPALTVPAYVYEGDLQVTFQNGDIVTYFDIQLTVTDDVTK